MNMRTQDLETYAGHSIEAFAIYKPGREGAMTFVLTKDQAGQLAAYCHQGDVTPARCANHGTKLSETAAREAFAFTGDYRR